MSDTEFERRRAAALEAIKDSCGTEAAEYGIDLFVSHHLEDVPQAYWLQQLATATPDASAVIGLLVCRSWGQDDLEIFDFTLPDNVTNYVVSVHFDEDGEIDDISMES